MDIPKKLLRAVTYMDAACKPYRVPGWIPFGKTLYDCITEEEDWKTISGEEKVLELGSGSGSSALIWSYKGYSVTGIELHPGLASTSREMLSHYARLQSVPVRIIEGSYYPKDYIDARNRGLHTYITQLENIYDQRKPLKDIAQTFMPVCSEDVYLREGIRISDFDIIQGFFWPYQLPSVCDIFIKYAHKDAKLFAVSAQNHTIALEMGLKVIGKNTFGK